MGLWLEHRTNGILDLREQFVNGKVNLLESSECDGTFAGARQLALRSDGLPLEKREWAPRIGFGE